MAGRGGAAQAPIIIRRKNVIVHPHHGGAWKVAFADFMTAMFAMFLVLWIVNQSTDVKDAIANYFRDPIGWENGGVRAIGLDSGGSPQPFREIDDHVALHRRNVGLGRVERGMREALAHAAALRQISDAVTVEMTEEGLRISLTENERVTFFDTGSSTLSPAARDVLAIVGGQLATVPNDVAIEGHTDARPYHDGEYGNWELSTDRANATRRALIRAGLHEDHVAEVRGYGDHDPLLPDQPLSPRNRRITITVLDAAAPSDALADAPASEEAQVHP